MSALLRSEMSCSISYRCVIGFSVSNMLQEKRFWKMRIMIYLEDEGGTGL